MKTSQSTLVASLVALSVAALTIVALPGESMAKGGRSFSGHGHVSSSAARRTTNFNTIRRSTGVMTAPKFPSRVKPQINIRRFNNIPRTFTPVPARRNNLPSITLSKNPGRTIGTFKPGKLPQITRNLKPRSVGNLPQIRKTVLKHDSHGHHSTGHHPHGHRRHCFPRIDWCHYRPVHCHWWYDYCRPIRYCAPVDCVSYAYSYVSCVDYYWYLGLNCTLLPGKGVGISAVEAGSPAALAGLKPGMVITRTNGIDLVDKAAMPNAIAQSNGVLNMAVLNQADGKAVDVRVAMTRMPKQSF